MSHGRVNNQPSGQHGMVVAPGGGGNRNTKNMPVDADGREWSNGLCGCCGAFGTCLCACILPCVVYGKNKHRYQHLDQQGTPEPSPGCCSGSCIAHGIFATCGLGFIFQMVNRGHVRHRYNIKGSGCGDCCASFWCSPCQLVQESREIELEEQSFGTGRY